MLILKDLLKVILSEIILSPLEVLKILCLNVIDSQIPPDLSERVVYKHGLAFRRGELPFALITACLDSRGIVDL